MKNNMSIFYKYGQKTIVMHDFVCKILNYVLVWHYVEKTEKR